jgi:hypothetical protein
MHETLERKTIFLFLSQVDTDKIRILTNILIKLEFCVPQPSISNQS